VTFSKLGTDIQTGAYVELPQASRRQGLYIIGANGTGKTGLIENLILQDIEQGLGVGLLDPHGDLTNAILEKMTKESVKRFV
jgi:ABC-type branched-subunit amino acid transport system ATPase component